MKTKKIAKKMELENGIHHPGFSQSVQQEVDNLFRMFSQDSFVFRRRGFVEAEVFHRPPSLAENCQNLRFRSVFLFSLDDDPFVVVFRKVFTFRLNFICIFNFLENISIIRLRVFDIKDCRRRSENNKVV